MPDGDRERLGALLEQRIGEVGLPEGWIGERERQRALRMVAKLAEYAARARGQGRSLVAVEQDVEVRLGELVVRGQVDRLERDADGRLVVVDLKTGKTKPTKARGRAEPSARGLPGGGRGGRLRARSRPGVRSSGGAELVQLGDDTQKVGVQAQPPLPRDADPDWARTLLRTVAAGMSAESFEARRGPHCRMCSVRRSCPTRSRAGRCSREGRRPAAAASSSGSTTSWAPGRRTRRSCRCRRPGAAGRVGTLPRGRATAVQEPLLPADPSFAGPLDAAEIARLLGRPAPTPEQVEVIEAPLEPLLVVAGAGSGKTETMAARVVWLVANGHVRPRRCSA